jgi:hypothetical protein
MMTPLKRIVVTPFQQAALDRFNEIYNACSTKQNELSILEREIKTLSEQAEFAKRVSDLSLTDEDAALMLKLRGPDYE